MSNLTQFAPFASGGLKSFQTGFVNTLGTNTTSSGQENAVILNVTVSAITVAKTITAFQGNVQQTSVAFISAADAVFPTTLMTTTTNLRIASTYNNGGGQYFTGRWQAAEAN
jgi:hypothetical protein